MCSLTWLQDRKLSEAVFLHFKCIIKIPLNTKYMQRMNHVSSGAKTDQQVKYTVYKRPYMVQGQQDLIYWAKGHCNTQCEQ